MSFTQKELNVTFDLAQGSFAGGGNSATLTGLRIIATVTKRGGYEQSFAEISIYGMSLSLMNQLANVGNRWGQTFPNGITLTAGDEVNGQTTIFAGQMYMAFVDAMTSTVAGAQPNVCFRVAARPGYYNQMLPNKPVSIKGSADVAGMMQNLAKTMGYKFKNTGVTTKLADPYYSGTPWQQAAQIAKDAGIEWFVDNGTLFIRDPTKPLAGGPVLISPETGMIGYPAFNAAQVVVSALYNPNVQFGGEIIIESSLAGANGTWIVQDLTYQLESQLPRGRWMMTITGYTAGQVAP